jgi:translation elongation factor P/translation initiation factor 5A
MMQLRKILDYLEYQTEEVQYIPNGKERTDHVRVRALRVRERVLREKWSPSADNMMPVDTSHHQLSIPMDHMYMLFRDGYEK